MPATMRVEMALQDDIMLKTIPISRPDRDDPSTKLDIRKAAPRRKKEGRLIQYENASDPVDALAILFSRGSPAR